MDENVVAMPGVSPVALESETNADAIDVLERMLTDFRTGKYRALVVVATGKDDNWMRESASTTGEATKLIGLGHVMLHEMQSKIARSAWPN